MVKTLLAILAICTALDGADPWWNPQWRLRTSITRPAPDRDGRRKPVETVIDFPRLIRAAGVRGEFDPASLRVVEPGAGTELPFAWRKEFNARDGREQRYLTWFAQPGRHYDIYFDTKDRKLPARGYAAALLPPGNLLPGGRFATGWRVTPAVPVSKGARSLEISVDENTAPDDAREITVSRTIDVRAFAGEEMVFECDLIAVAAAHGAPATIELLQYRADGSPLLERAVDPRWLTVELAEGQLIQFSERGRFSPDAATVEVRLRFHSEVRDADTGQRVTGPDSRFRIRLDRVAIRPGERWPWPGSSHAGFVAGALSKAAVNRAFYFTGQRRLMFNGGSEGTLTAGQFHSDPKADHWGPDAGTLEFWCRPSWDAADGREHVLFDANAYGHGLQSRLRKLDAAGGNQLEFTIADADAVPHTIRGTAPLRKEQWHHLAATWDFAKARLQLFVDGMPAGAAGGGAPWPGAGTGCGINDKDRRSIPMQAFIGGDREWSKDGGADAAIDEFRVSDLVRYSARFVPAREEFLPDSHTRALFHFDNERDGVQGGDDRFVRGHLACELDPWLHAAPVEVLREGKPERRVAALPRPSPEEFETNRAESRIAVARPLREMPDPGYVEYRERREIRTLNGKDNRFILHAGGDFEPLLRSVTFRHADAGATETVAIPHWRTDHNVLPFSEETLRKTLATGARDDREKALEIFRYAVAVSNYFDGETFAETPPGGRMKGIAYAFIKALNIYPLNQCGPLNYTLRKLFLTMGLSSNDSPGTHHQFEQVYYKGSLRLFDLMPRIFWLERDDRTVASLRDIEDDPWLKLRQGSEVSSWLPGPVRRAAFGFAERPQDMTFSLRPGERASFCWQNEGRWFEVSRHPGPIPLAKLPPFYGNGAIEYKPVASGEAAVLDNLRVEGPVLRATDPARPASLIYRARAPYIFSDAQVGGKYTGAVKLWLSFDEGGNWQEVWRGSGASGTIDMRMQVAGRYAYWLKLEMSGAAVVTGLNVRTTTVIAPLSLPLKLARGDSAISFTGTPAVPVETECRWTERYRTNVGFRVDAMTYYLDGDATLRNVVVIPPGGEARVAATLDGGPVQGRISLEGLSGEMLAGPREHAVQTTRAGESASAVFTLKGQGLAAGDIRWFDVVLRQGERERRIPVQLLVTPAALVAEAEAAGMSGAASRAPQAGASGGAVAAFAGDGKLAFRCNVPQQGKYAVWLRARWEPGSRTNMALGVDEGAPRALRVRALIGLSDWTDPSVAHTKMFAYYGEQYAHWSWYRIPEVALAAGEHVLSVAAGAGAQFDALLVLPQTGAVDRAAMHLFQNWNYAPWQNPF